MRIHVLGPVRLSTDDGTPVDVPERKVRLLLAALVARRGEPVSADTLVEQVWGDDLPAHPRRVLRAKLSQLRAALGQAGPGARELLQHTPGGYRLDVGDAAVAVDAERFRAQVERARTLGAPGERAGLLDEALAAWQGEPYADADDELWLAPEIASLTELRLTAAEERAEALLEDGRPELAIEQASTVVTASPTREKLVRVLMLALYQAGRQHEALMRYDALRRRLADELGADPSPPTRDLHARILRQDPALTPAATEPPAPAGHLELARTNLPAEISPIIGRERETTEVLDLLRAGRLLTLTGIGGVGKTRLALHVAQLEQDRFDRGRWLVDLTELAPSAPPAPPDSGSPSPERIAALTAAALGLPARRGPADVLIGLGEALGDRAALIVLDNCEHVIGEVSAFVSALLPKAPRVRVLATSREPLSLPEEQRYEVPTLATGSPDDSGLSAAVAFFAARARAVAPGFTLDETTTPVVAELCRRLDGLPLALELAANRVRALSVHDLLERLTDRLNLLARPDRGAPRRQQTLRGMIDWSWSLLDGAEQAVLRRLAVHPGSWTLAAAEAVCADDGQPGPGDPGRPGTAVGSAEVMDVLTRLVDRSLVVTSSSPTGMPTDMPAGTPTGIRYTLLESIAAYAAEKLAEAAERDAVATRHLRYYLALAREADTHLRGPRLREWVIRLDAERTNLRHALDEALARRDGENAVALTLATFWHQWISGRSSHLGTDFAAATALPGPRDSRFAAASTLGVVFSLENRPGREEARVAEALRLFGDDDLARARVQWFAGTALMGLGFGEPGERYVDDAIAILHAHGDDWGTALAACLRDWFLLCVAGRPPRGLPDGRDARTILAGLGDDYGVSQTLAVQYQEAEVAGRYGRAAEVAEEALWLCCDLRLWSESSFWLTVTATTALRAGDRELFGGRLAEARTIAAESGYTAGLFFADFAEAVGARHAGELGRARGSMDRWLANGDAATADAITLLEDGFLALQEGRPDRAEAALHTLQPALLTIGGPPTVARMLELRAGIHALRKEPDPAAALLGVADAARADSPEELTEPERADLARLWEMVRDQLADDELAAAYARGRRRDVAEEAQRGVRTQNSWPSGSASTTQVTSSS